MSTPVSRFRFLLFEPMHEAGTRLLRDRGEVRLAPALDETTLLSAVGDVDALVIRNLGAVSRKLIGAAPRLKVIGRHGVGLETIDVAAATERGIRVVNTPEGNCESVAEHFVGMALVLSKRLLEADQALRHDARSARVEVADTGCGIAPNHLDRIFQPFFTTKAAGSKSGSGLGLAIVQAIISDHQGSITVESTVGRGTRFTVVIPAAVDARGPVAGA